MRAIVVFAVVALATIASVRATACEWNFDVPDVVGTGIHKKCDETTKEICAGSICGQFVGGDCERWTWSSDSYQDNTGGVGYEIYGMATHTDKEFTYFFINSGQPLSGLPITVANPMNNITATDIIITFNATGPTFNADQGKPNRYGVHFVPDSSSNVIRPGVYWNVTASSVYSTNNGWSTVNAYWTGIGTHLWGGGMNTTYGSPAGGIPRSYWNGSQPYPGNINTGIFLDAAAYGGLSMVKFNADLYSANPTRFWVNNPEGLHALIQKGTPNKYDPTNICDSNYFHDITCESQGSVATDYLALKPTGWIGSYNYGIRVRNQVFGSYWETHSNYRACFAFECGNDFMCIDAKLDCN